VVYLRALAEPLRAAAGYPRNDLFPLLPANALGPFLILGKIELVREAATLIMLAAVGLAASSTFRSWLAAFSLAFGAWDVTFYLWLRVLIGWPKSLGTWDLLFLLPVPWTGPVIAPVIVSASLIFGGILGLKRQPSRVAPIAWALLGAGGVLVFVSFIWDWQRIVAGGMPEHFPWAIFLSGEIAGLIGLAVASRRPV